jgi:hypothetical protein
MAHYLAGHPEILFSEPKELRFFHTDFHRHHRLVHDVDEYLACFGAPRRRARFPWLAEGTVWYLYSREAVPNILRFNPEARFLVMLRDPVHLARSLHAQLLYGGDEDEPSFAAAWELQAARRRGQRIPPTCREPRVLQYEAVASLGEQLERLYGLVPRERVHVMLHDDLKGDPRATYLGTLGFLGIADDGRRAFPRINESRTVHRRKLASVLYRAGTLKRRLGIYGSFGIWRALSPIVSRRRRYAPMPEELQARLRDTFRPDVERLSHLVGRDLTGWTV